MAAASHSHVDGPILRVVRVVSIRRNSVQMTTNGPSRGSWMTKAREKSAERNQIELTINCVVARS